MDSEAVEMLALSGGFTALLSIVELVLAFIILSRGAGGMIQAFLLLVWVLITLGLMLYYARVSRDWVDAYREMTNDLVERMVGHRTRLAQEDPLHWHDEEDQALDRYIKLSETLDRAINLLNSIVLRGWLLVGMLGIAFPYIAGNTSPQSLAISLGGVLLASQALGKLVSGSQGLVGLYNAWKQVGPLFHAAARPVEKASLSILPSSQLDRPSTNAPGAYMIDKYGRQPLLTARELVFRYRAQGRPILQGCSLQIYPGDKVLLEGPSGGGKSTLASVLTGLRQPEMGSLLLWGFDRKILGAEEWRQRVVMAPQFQENHVFSETFAFNLLAGRRWPAKPEDLHLAEEICRELGLGEVLDRMPSGFQQMLGESGWQLSHGERSRLFIARALLQKADLVILDESFGALDPENLYRALRCVLDRAPTLLVIAHP
jgi:ATP-binding cassette subfamily B protein